MAITKTSWASFIPILWAQRILAQLRLNIIATGLVARDYEDEVRNIGDTVRIGKIGALTVADKVANTNVTRQSPAATHVDLVLDKHKIVPFTIEDVARAQANPAAMDAQVAEAARALAEQMEADVLAAIVASAGATIGTAGTDAAAALLLTLRKTMVDAKVPQTMSKFALWATKDVNKLLDPTVAGHSQFTKANERGDAGSALREGAIGRLYGIEHFESQAINVVAGSPATTQNVAFVRDAVQMAVRPLPPPPDGVGAKGVVVTDPESGLALRMVSQYDINAVGLATNVEVLYGIKVVRPEWTVLART